MNRPRGAADPDRSVMVVPFGTRLIDVPVYRVSPAEFEREQDREFERIAEVICGSMLDPGSLGSEREARIRDLVRRESGGGYQFNQIMGWAQVVWDGPGPVIKCYYVRVAARRIPRVFRARRFESMGKIAELWFDRSDTSASMLAEVRSALVEETRGGGMMRGRFLDLEVFDNLAPVLDLRTLLRLDAAG